MSAEWAPDYSRPKAAVSISVRHVAFTGDSWRLSFRVGRRDHNRIYLTNMIIEPQKLSRREFIEAYLKYEAQKPKKNLALPSDIDEWDWNNPNAIDQKLRSSGFKFGIISGFKYWQRLTLPKEDLLKCAIVNCIFPGEQQVLSSLVSLPKFWSWRPDRQTEWYGRLNGGGPFSREWALILRPAVSSERPAVWYIEDGGGRAICFLRRLIRENDQTSVACGYLGEDPDSSSEFMTSRYHELLSRAEGSG